MTITLCFDQTKGCRGEFQAVGSRIERRVTVTGLTGDGPARILAAVTHDQMPIVGTSYYAACDPNELPENVNVGALQRTILRSIIADAVAPDTVVCTLVYEVPSVRVAPNSTLIEVGTRQVQRTTNKDAEGNTITVEYNGDVRSVLISTTGTESYLICRRTEDTDPSTKSENYTDHTNSDTFRGRPPGTWICNSITGVSQDGGNTYEVTYEFTYRATGWQENVVYIDSETGTPPADLVEGVGDKMVTVKRAIPFAALGLF